MDSLQLTTIINTLSAAIAQQLNDDELSLLAVIFTQIGDTLGTISTLRDVQ